MLRFSPRDLSLRLKITLAFLPVVLGGTAVSISIGSRVMSPVVPVGGREGGSAAGW
jgi:hypothetical protein